MTALNTFSSSLPHLLFGCSEQNADLLYLTGFLAPDPFPYFETPDGQKILPMHSLEIERARQQVRPGITVVPYDQIRQEWDPSLAPNTHLNATTILLAAAKHFQIQEWAIPNNFPAKMYQTLTQAGIRLSFPSPEHPYCPERAVKDKTEIEKVRQAERIAEAGLYRALQILKESEITSNQTLLWNQTQVTSELLIGEINAEIARYGGVGAQTIAACGIQAACPHNCGTGLIYANQPIVFDIFPRDCSTGYFGDLSRTVVKGKATDEIRRAFDTVYEIQQKVTSLLKPGICGKELQLLVEAFFKSKGYETNLSAEVPYGFIHGLGHGIGLDIHELPHLNHRGETPLVPGNIVSNEPGLYYPAWGGIRIEDAIAITENGADNLAVAPVQLEIP